MRTLYLNLKDKQNPALRNEIVLNYITAEQVANMSKDVSASNLAIPDSGSLTGNGIGKCESYE